MFYYLSKLLDFLIMPYNVLLIGLIVAFFLAKQKRIKGLVGFILLGLYLQSNSYVVARLYKLWEWPPKDMEMLTKKYDLGIILSGGLLSSCTPATGYYDLERGSDRLLAGFFLYKRGVCRKLMLTGTDHDALLARGRGEVQLAKALLIEWGVSPEDILLETNARNTYENAKYVASLLKEQTVSPDQSLLLVTSSYHMRRAKGCFTKAGVNVDAFPSDFHADPGCLPLRKQIVPEPKASEAFQKLWREWIGMIMYRIAGYC